MMVGAGPCACPITCPERRLKHRGAEDTETGSMGVWEYGGVGVHAECLVLILQYPASSIQYHERFLKGGR